MEMMVPTTMAILLTLIAQAPNKPPGTYAHWSDDGDGDGDGYSGYGDEDGNDDGGDDKQDGDGDGDGDGYFERTARIRFHVFEGKKCDEFKHESMRIEPHFGNNEDFKVKRN